jgi:hypothetical protein
MWSFVDSFITEVSQDTLAMSWDLGLSFQAPIAGSAENVLF